tara:strand:- start:1966 stop:2937 length:972 start_codon:yes stop_codon:yes gene_type:complete
MPLYKSDVHIDRALTSYALGYSNADFVGGLLFPELKVAKDSDKYFVFGTIGKRQIFGDGNTSTVWEDGTDPPEVSDGRTTQTYSCIQHGLSDKVTDSELRNSDSPLRPFQDKTVFLQELLALDMEKAIATKATTQANYPSANRTQLSGSSQWSDTSGTSDPINDVMVASDAVRKVVGKWGNTLVVSGEVFIKLLQHPDIMEFSKRHAAALPDEAFFANFFRSAGITRFGVAGGIKNTANEFATESISDVWGKHAVVAYVAPSPAIGTPSYGYNFASIPAQVEREARRNHAVKIITSRNWDPEFVCADSNGDAIGGYLIEDAVA